MLSYLEPKTRRLMQEKRAIDAAGDSQSQLWPCPALVEQCASGVGGMVEEVTPSQMKWQVKELELVGGEVQDWHQVLLSKEEILSWEKEQEYFEDKCCQGNGTPGLGVVHERLQDLVKTWGKEKLPPACTLSTAGLREIGTSDLVVQWATEGVKFQWKGNPPPLHVEVSNKDNSCVQFGDWIEDRIQDYVEAGVIEKCGIQDVCCIQPIKVVVSGASNKKRLIFVSCFLNKYLQEVKFKYESINKLGGLVEENCWMGKIDIASGYHVIPIYKDHQKYLGIRWKNQVYKFKCLDFGISIAPWVYTRTMK